jgi:hypothetical protein
MGRKGRERGGVDEGEEGKGEGGEEGIGLVGQEGSSEKRWRAKNVPLGMGK